LARLNYVTDINSMDESPKRQNLPSGEERRLNPRAQIVRPIRIRTESADSSVELRKTRDISRTGFFFVTHLAHYHVGMRIYVVMGYQPGDPIMREWLGEVKRIEKLPGGTFGIGVHILMR
jgi:hypothetical protein